MTLTRVLPIIVAVAFATLITSCEQDSSVDADVARTGYVELGSNSTGIDFANNLRPSTDLNIIEYLYYYNGSGVAIGDIDGDGLDDIYLGANQGSDKLYRNVGGLQFEDITKGAGISSDSTWTSGVSMADYNGDGHLDIYVCKVSIVDYGQSRNRLYINDGTGHFTDQAPQMGLDFRGFSTQAAPLDYDRDGDLDMYLLNHTVHSVQSYGSIKNRDKIDTLAGDVLFENRLNEDGRFHNVSIEKGIYSSPLGYGLAVTTADFNADGWVDIYVGNDFHENDYLYLNDQGQGFKESIGTATGHTSQFSMGVDVGDINGDQALDFFTTDMMPYLADVALRSGGEDTDQVKRIKKRLGYEDQQARNHMQIKTTATYWSDQAYMTGTFATDWSWSVLLEDFDNNGKTDVYISNGIVRRPNDLDYINYLNQDDNQDGPERYKRLIEHMPEQPLRNVLFSQSDVGFSDVHHSLVGQPGYSTGAACADLDRDGDMDVVLNNVNAPATIVRNDASQGNWLTVDLQYPGESALHSTVVVYSEGQAIYRQLHTVRGFQSSSSDIVHLGLGDLETIDSLVVTWPDDYVQVVKGVSVNQHASIIRMTDLDRKRPQPSDGSSMAETLRFPHQDAPYFDDVVEKLIPERLSAEGPAVVVEDFNGDGYDDAFMGGGKDSPAIFLVGQRDGSFKTVRQASFLADAKYEDVSAASIDFDNDGDLDIYVVSGGNEKVELDKQLEDRLYLNNGNNDFRRVPLSLPHTNGGTVAVADYNGDGYDDIFVGGRSIPRAYGLVPYSFILTNDAGRAVKISLKERLGMITDAEWTDVNADDQLDLIIVGDWMPPRLFLQEDEYWKNATSDYHLDSMIGMWNSVTTIDYNGDDKPDLLLGNLGTNHKWQASVDRPVKMYVGDFDKNGSAEQIIFYDYFGRYVPASGLDQLKGNLPQLKKRFANYKTFAQVTSIDELDPSFDSLVVEERLLTELRSCLLIGTDSGYEMEPLPMILQSTDIRDMLVVDKDLYAIGNNATAVAQYGVNTSMSGCVIKDFMSGQRTARPLPIPQDIFPSKLSVVSGDHILITAHADYPYLLDVKNI